MGAVGSSLFHWVRAISTHTVYTEHLPFMIAFALFLFYRRNYSINVGNLRVYLGRMTQHGTNRNETMRNVQKIYIHSLFDNTTDNCDNDIALLHLSSPVTFNNYISPVCLIAQGSDFPAGTRSQIIGWGQTAPRGTYVLVFCQ